MHTPKTIRSIATTTPAAVAQEILLLELARLRETATQIKSAASERTDYISQLKRELEAV